MILDEFVQVRIQGTNKRYYESLGYNIPKYISKKKKEVVKKDTFIDVKFEHLPKTSAAKFKVMCEVCKKVRITSLNSINKKNTVWVKTGETPCTKCYSSSLIGKNNPNYNGRQRTRYTSLKHTSAERGKEMSLSLIEFKQITSQKCHYCGQFSKDKDYCGIDRKNSNEGYTLENSLPCCKNCNWAKNDTPYEEFKEHIKKMYNHMFGALT